MLDFDLAEMYSVSTKRLKEQVRRNIERFPSDFMFQLTPKEWEPVAICDQLPKRIKHSSIIPLAFTQEGAATLSGVLRSPVAIETNIRIMRAFVAVREYIIAHASESAEIAKLRERVSLLEQTTERLEREDDENVKVVNDLSEDMRKELDNLYNAIGALSVRIPKLDKRKPIGFK